MSNYEYYQLYCDVMEELDSVRSDVQRVINDETLGESEEERLKTLVDIYSKEEN